MSSARRRWAACTASRCPRSSKKLRELGLVRLADGLYRIKSLQALIDYCDGRGGD